MKGLTIRRWGIVLGVTLVPLLIVGAALTVSVFGAIFGVPILVATVPPAQRSIRLVRSGGDDGDRRLGTWTMAVVAILAVGLVSAAVIGANDLDSALDIGAVVVSALWIGAMGAAALGVRPRPSPHLN